MTKGSYKKPFSILFLIVATELIGFGLIIPVLPQISLRFESNMFLIGVLMASYSFAQFFAAPILGSLSDQYGRKNLLLISKLGTLIAYIILAYSQSFTWFLLARLLDGFTGGNISVARAYVVDITKPEDRPKGMAIIGMAFGVGFVFGPALGGFLYGAGHMLPALVAGSLSGIAFLFTLFFLEEPKKAQNSRSAAGHLFMGFASLKHKPILIICLVQLVYMTIFSGFETTLAIFTFERYGFSVQENSWLFVYAGILAIIFQGSMMRKVSKNVKGSVLFGCIFVGLGFIGFGALKALGIFLVSMAVLSLGIAHVNVYLPSLLSKVIPKGQEGEIMGVYEGIGSLSRILGPLIAYTSIMSNLNQGYLIYGSVMMIIGLFLYVTFNPQPQS